MAHPGRSPSRQHHPDPDLQLERPNSARMYDYYLGGPANFAMDREVAEHAPFVGVWARENRSFSGRAVRYLCEQGIDQFLDLGSGVPTIGNVHEIVHHANSMAQVAYVDYEPVAVNHARRLLAGTERVTVTQADICEPAQVLAAPGVAGCWISPAPQRCWRWRSCTSFPTPTSPPRYWPATGRPACRAATC